MVQLEQVVTQGDTRALVVAQLEERSLPTPEISGSNLVNSKTLSTNCTIEKMKVKKKRPRMAHLLKNPWSHLL